MADDRLRFIVVADSHIRFPGDDVATYPSNAFMVARNEWVVELCNRMDAAFVVHLGDIVHPLPVEDAHEPAVRLAATVYEQLRHPLHSVPGNHDIGDKPNALVGVPAVADEFYDVYEQHWGEPYGSFDVGDCHFVMVDTPVLNSGLEREHAQRGWIEADLVAAHRAGKRIFVFTHYPPFIRERDEFEHYDNLGEPARTWLLNLLDAHGVEAVFSGHVHNFLYNRHGDTDLYVAPSTGFVRPDYAELAAVTPEREGGRDDRAKLGFFVVDVHRDGHEIMPIRTFGGTVSSNHTPGDLDTLVDPTWKSPIGVRIRHAWSSSIDLPTAGLDEFNRKTVRSDGLLMALWEARIRHAVVPLADVASQGGLCRLRALAGRGMTFAVRSGGVPDARALGVVASLDGASVRWEIVATRERFRELVDAVGRAEIPEELRIAIAPVVPLAATEGAAHHFVTSGFDPEGGRLLDEWLAVDEEGAFRDLVFRVRADASPVDEVGIALGTAIRVGRGAVVAVDLPRHGEAMAFEDDAAVADLVGQAVRAAVEHPEASVLLDGFMDHDRGYYPHHGLIDRRYDPRPALYRLVAESARAGAH